MKTTTTLLLLIFSFCTAFGQKHFTPYDEHSSVLRSYKPTYESNFPEWTKQLYQFPVNINDVAKDYEIYMNKNKDAQAAYIKYYKLWKRSMAEYADAEGNIHLPDVADVTKAINKRSVNASQRQNLSAAKPSDSWSLLGPIETYWMNPNHENGKCPWQLNIYSIDVSASNNDIMFAGTETGFVNKTTDAGLNWTLVSRNYPMGGVTAVAIHPTNPDIVLCAGGNQIHKSADGGNTWMPVYTESHVDRMIFDYDDPQKMYAAAEDGILVSTNTGATWNKKFSGGRCYDVNIKPGDNNVVYGIVKSSSNTFSIVGSLNGGETFEVETKFPTGISQGSGGLVAVTPDNPQSLFVVMLSSDNTPFLYKGTFATDTTWTKLATGQTTELGMNNGQGYFDLALEVSPTDEDLILVATTTLYKSTNGGSFFTKIGGYGGAFPIHPDVQDMKMLPSGNTWVATDGGMNYTTDNFTTREQHFARNNGLVGSDMWGFDQGWNEDLVVGGRYHNGNTAIGEFYNGKALRLGGAESPTGWILKGKSRHAVFNDLGQGWILPKTFDGPPEGRYPFSKFPNMREYGGRRGNMVCHPNYYETIYVGEGTGFWKSIDGGKTFELIYSFGTNNPDSDSETGEVRYFQISHKDPNVIYADVRGRGLYRSNDGGYSWSSKPSVTRSEYGGTGLMGSMSIAISPYDENTVYVCYSNGTWSKNTGKAFKSTDGGSTWTNITGGMVIYPKGILAVPSESGTDVLYFYSTAKNGSESKVYVRQEGQPSWGEYSTNLPRGIGVNLAMPFYRDSKLRLAGSAGVWEAPLKHNFTPIVNPMAQKQDFDCMYDTVIFDDHSMLDHEGATWEWEFSVTPEYIDDANQRRVKVVFGVADTVDVTLTVTKDGEIYTKTVEDMITLITCPSVNDCSNPAELDKSEWNLIYYDSEELNYPGKASMAIDNDYETIWHTSWSAGTDPYPHEIQVGLGDKYFVHSFIYSPRPSGPNGIVNEYELYLTKDKSNWGTPASEGSFSNEGYVIDFENPVSSNYFKFKALSEKNGGAWTSAAELTIIGCVDTTTIGINKIKYNTLKAFPVPTKGKINLSNFSSPGYKELNYSIVSSTGRLVKKGKLEGYSSDLSLDFSDYSPGIYMLILTEPKGVKYRVKVMKE